VVEQEVGTSRPLAGMLPCRPKVENGLSVVTGEDKVLRTLARCAGREKLIDFAGHAHDSPVVVLGRARREPDRATHEIKLMNLKQDTFGLAPPKVGSDRKHAAQ